MKLEMKHLSAYLPYGLKMSSSGRIYVLRGFIIESALNVQDKPILRPLSDLTKDIEHNGEIFVPKKALSVWDLEGITYIDTPYIPVNLYEILLKWHFDVFGLIDKGIAIDINTLNK